MRSLTYVRDEQSKDCGAKSILLPKFIFSRKERCPISPKANTSTNNSILQDLQAFACFAPLHYLCIECKNTRQLPALFCTKNTN